MKPESAATIIPPDVVAALDGLNEMPPHALSPWSGDITLEKAFSLIHELQFRVDELNRKLEAITCRTKTRLKARQRRK